MKKPILFFLILFAQACRSQVLLVNDAIFEESVLKSSVPVVVKFYIPKCGACLQLEPVFLAVSDQISGVKFMQLNTQLNSRMREKYKVKTVPVMMIFVNGKIVYRTNAVRTEQQLLEMIRKYVH